MPYLRQLYSPSYAEIGRVNVQSATPTKLGQNSTSVDIVSHIDMEERELR
jgi:hypothetical protein